jgi:Predicted transcriptional regulators
MSAIRLFVLSTLAEHGAMHGHQIRHQAQSDHAELWTEVKVGALYGALKRLAGEGLIGEVRSERPGNFPERTVYEITDTGRKVARDWLLEMLAVPEREFPVFPAALSHLLMLSKAEMQDALEQRLTALERTSAALDTTLAGESGGGLPRITVLEIEYLRTVTGAEVGWLRSVIDDLRSGRLTWSPDELVALSEADETLEP